MLDALHNSILSGDGKYTMKVYGQSFVFSVIRSSIRFSSIFIVSLRISQNIGLAPHLKKAFTVDETIEQFEAAVKDDKVRKAMAMAMEQQSKLVSDIRRKGHD